MPLDTLPTELVVQIAAHLSLIDVCATICTTRAWRQTLEIYLRSLTRTSLPFSVDLIGLSLAARTQLLRRLDRIAELIDRTMPRLRLLRVGSSTLLVQFFRRRISSHVDLGPSFSHGLKSIDDLLPFAYFIARWIRRNGVQRVHLGRTSSSGHAFNVWPLGEAVIDLSGIELADEGTALVAMLLLHDGRYGRPWRRVREMRFDGCAMSDNGALALGVALAANAQPDLQALSAEYCELTPQGLAWLLLDDGAACASLTMLDLAGNDAVGDDGASILARCIKGGALGALRTLQLRGCGVCDEGGRLLGEALGEGDAGSALARGGRCTHLERLLLDGNSLGDGTLCALAEAMLAGHLPELCTLWLQHPVPTNEGYGDVGVVALAGALAWYGGKGLCCTIELQLHSHRLTNRGADALADALERHPMLVRRLGVCGRTVRWSGSDDEEAAMVVYKARVSELARHRLRKCGQRRAYVELTGF
jgi:hypothetical protein